MEYLDETTQSTERQSAVTNLYKNDSVRDLVSAVRRRQHDREKPKSSLLHVCFCSTKGRQRTFYRATLPGKYARLEDDSNTEWNEQCVPILLWARKGKMSSLSLFFLFSLFQLVDEASPIQTDSKRARWGNSHHREDEEDEEEEKRKECDDKISSENLICR